MIDKEKKKRLEKTLFIDANKKYIEVNFELSGEKGYNGPLYTKCTIKREDAFVLRKLLISLDIAGIRARGIEE